MRVIRDGDLRALNSFGVCARARHLALLDDPRDLPSLLELRERLGLPLLVLGAGSNILFRRDYPGIVAHVRLSGVEMVASDDGKTRVRAAAGESWARLVERTLAADCGGLENLSLIPGTVGAAPIQNIGAYGVELSQRVDSLEALCLETGASRVFGHSECGFGYRHSVFKGALSNRYLITSVSFELSSTSTPVLHYGGISEALRDMGVTDPSPQQIGAAVCRLRRQKLPDPRQLGNAGSFFKNPIVDTASLGELKLRCPELTSWPQEDGQHKIPAAKLIELLGWKGERRGDAGVYRRHALVMVNHGTASGEQIWALAKDIQASVQEAFGVTLEPEPLVL